MNAGIGVITVLYKSDSVLQGFIDCFNKQTHQHFEVIFIENDVENTFCEAYIKKHARIAYDFIRNPKNLGVAVANNQGIDYFKDKAGIDFILFLNNDIEVDDDFLAKQLFLFDKYSFIDALAPKMYYYQPANKIWYAGGSLSYLKSGVRHFGHNKTDKLTGKEIFRVTYAPTCSLMIKKGVLAQSGIRMWENLFVYADDYVFSLELKKKGIKLYYTPDIKLRHKISSSTGGTKSEFSRYYIARNWAYLVRKNKNIGFLLIPFWMIYNRVRGNKIENKAIADSFKMI